MVKLLDEYWKEMDAFEKEENPLYNHYTSAIINLGIAILMAIAAIMVFANCIFIIYDTTRKKWLRRRRVHEVRLEFERRINAIQLNEIEQADDEQVRDEQIDDEQVGEDEHYV